MAGRKAESFMRGALLLSLAALVSRILGAFYKPVVARIFAPFDGHNGATGIGLTQVPLTTYQVILSFTSVGLNVGISRLVAERMALGDATGARRVFRISLVAMTVLGLLSAVMMWVGAPWIAGLISKDALDTIPGFKATAPALLITSMMAAYRGLFQGFQEMAPNALSQIIEQIIRVGTGVLLTYFVLSATSSVPLGAAAFNFGDVLGAIVALLYLVILFRRAGRGLWTVDPQAATSDGRAAPRSREEAWGLLKRIFAIAGPIALAGAVVPLMMQADTFFVLRSLAQLGLPKDDAQAQYGLLTNAFMIAYLPTVFTSAIYTSILPSITQAITLGQNEAARRRSISAYRITMLLAIPAQAGLYVLAQPLYAMLFRDPSGGTVMAAISWAVVPIMLQQTTSGVLQGMGQIGLPVRNFMVGAVVKVVLTAYWTASWGIAGAAYATGVGFVVAALLNLVYVERLLGRILKTRAMILKPAGAAVAMALVIGLLRGPLGRFLPSGALGTLLLIAVGGFVYGLVLLIVGGVRRQEIEFLPKVGRPLAGLLARARLLR